MAAYSSPQTYQGISVGAFGSTIITGTGLYTGNWQAIRSLDASFVLDSGTKTADVVNDSYLTGKTFTPPFEILGNFTGIKLSSGACVAVNAG
jgi:hypothetical protein